MSLVYINFNLTKKDIIELIKKTMENDHMDVYLIPQDETFCNCIFSADVFRRNGHIVNIEKVYNYETNVWDSRIFISLKNVVLDKQITRDDNLEDLKLDNISHEKCMINIKSCGTAVKLAWDYCNYLIDTGEWLYNDSYMSAIPVKVNDKNIFKTTLQLKLVRVISPAIFNVVAPAE